MIYSTPLPLNNIGDSFDEEGSVSYGEVNMETNDNNGWLRDRNRKVFGVDEGSFGTAWKQGKVGDIYKEESYYVEPDFGWLGKINGSRGGKIIGGENMKSRISGIGLKITRIDGEPIWGRDKKVLWSDLRGNNGWSLQSNGDIKGEQRKISVQRVAYYEENEGTKKKIVDLGQGVCMLKLPRDKGNVYLVVGVAALSKDVRGERNKGIKWNDEIGYVDEKWTICEGIKGLVEGGVTIVLDWYENKSNLRVDKKSTLLIGNKNGKAVSWKRSWDKTENVAVVLGVAVKCSNWKSPEEWKSEGYKCKEDEGRDWVKDLAGRGGAKLTVDKNKGFISIGDAVTWEAIGNFKTTASAKFSWSGK